VSITTTLDDSHSGPVFNQALRRWLHFNGHIIRAGCIGAISLALALLAWDLLTVNQVVFFIRFTNIPTPGQVFSEAIRAMRSADFQYDILVSCQRVFTGFGVAALSAVPLGLMVGRFLLLRNILFPIIEVLRPIPAIAWVPISIMLWPSNEQSIVFITFLGSFFPIFLNTLHGVRNVDPVLRRAAECLGARQSSVFIEVLLPASLSDIFAGLNIGMGVAWVSLIAAEMISGQSGVGYFTWNAYSLIQYPDIVLGMITIGLLGLLSSMAIRVTGYMLMPWRRL
jgi:NitT/TauT family transport system permease protein